MGRGQNQEGYQPELGFVSHLPRTTKVFKARELWSAQRHTSDLGLEFPQSVEDYRTPLRAFRHLTYLASLETDDFRSNIIVRSGTARAIGMASIRRKVPKGTDLNPRTSAELSFWHRPLKGKPVEDFDEQVINILADDRRYMMEGDDSQPIEQTWTTTLSKDIAKAITLTNVGFKPERSTRLFKVDDHAEPRQLWIRTEQD